MLMQNLGGAQTFDTPGMATSVDQSNSLVGAPQIQAAGMPSFDMGSLNSTAIQNPDVMNMIKALKGGM